MSKISIQDFDEIINQELPSAAEANIQLETITEGKAIMRLPYNERSIRPGGSISGPHMMLLGDACMYAVVLSMIGKVTLAVTTNFNINFLRKPVESDLIAEGNIIKLGKRLAIMEVQIYSESKDSENILVAHATGTYSIPVAKT